MCWRLGGDLQGVWGWAGENVTRGGYRNAQSNLSTSAAGIDLLKTEGFKHRVKDDNSENNVEVLQNSN